ncbi:MAG: hypothetical protein J7647_01695 [Cyanobacteria bacterium SBLK]|nr:hypothetical protein [Cyanobacteria bacterium SBLK]
MYRGDLDHQTAFKNYAFSGQITNLRLNARIQNSSPSGDFPPQFYDNYSRYQGVPTIQNLLGESNHLIILLQQGDFLPWIEIGKIPLINNSNTEYSLIDLLYFYPLDFFHSRASIGVKVTKNLLHEDKLTFWGGYQEQYTPNNQNNFSFVNSINIMDTPKIILQPNENRKNLVIFNSGEKTVYIALNANATTNNYSYILPPNFTHEIKYSGIVSAICKPAELTSLQITEIL